MFISNNDLKLLQKIETELWNTNSNLYYDLWKLNESLLKQKEERNKKVVKRIREKRKTNKLYARSKKEIERYNRTHNIKTNKEEV